MTDTADVTRHECEDLPTIVGGWKTESVTIAGHTFQMSLPADPDDLLDTPETLAAHERDEYMPYWGWIWPAAREMAAEVLRTDWPSGTRCLEIGAGVGLVGLAALARGYEVTITDYDENAVLVADHNARLNGCTAFEARTLDWRHPPDRPVSRRPGL